MTAGTALRRKRLSIANWVYAELRTERDRVKRSPWAFNIDVRTARASAHLGSAGRPDVGRWLPLSLDSRANDLVVFFVFGSRLPPVYTNRLVIRSVDYTCS